MRVKGMIIHYGQLQFFGKVPIFGKIPFLCQVLFFCQMLFSCQALPPNGNLAAKEISNIALPNDEPFFPAGKGKEKFVANCMVCHSLRYISMQPNFSEKVWKKEVDKMITVYGAHIDPEEAQEIISYLSIVKGKAASAKPASAKQELRKH